MKQGIPSRRTRGRGNTRGRQQSNIRNQQMDSNGPVGRLRGTPQQILDRYSALARDASSSGDMVLAENLWQHAEHYVRLLSASQPQQQQNQAQQGGNGQRHGNGRDDQYDFDDQDDDGSGDNSQQEPRRNEQVESLVVKSEPEPPAAKPAAPEPAPKADPGETEQPSTPPVWTKEDAQAASDEAETERPAAPRRRRRTRFPRQADGAENASSDHSSDDGNSQAKDDAASPTLALPDDPSPAALVDLLTRAEEAAPPRRKRTANSDNSDS